MNKLLLLLLFFISITGYSQKKTNIISHDKELIVTDPSKGYNSYKRTATFPSKEKKIRSIILNITFECPDTMNCAHWDYAQYIKARQKNDTTTYEIARMLTPYGGQFQKNWKYDWKVDITDFSKILRDEVEIDYIHTGYEDNKTRGWKITVDFEITYGTPVANPIAIHTIYEGHYKYGDKTDPIEKYLIPKRIKASPKTEFSILKTHQTGHGMDANGCGEFCDKYRETLFNGTVVNRKNIWMECGDNPLYPQAGTWIFDRANWCPGYLVQPDELLLETNANESFTIEFNMQPYETENPSAKENISSYLIEYESPNAKNDVTLVDIIQPSTALEHSRKNPIGGFPVIKIKNNGENPLKTIDINYFIEGEKKNTYRWKGNIPFNESAIIALPKEIFSKKQSASFHVTLSKPNGRREAYKADNYLKSTYKRPNILPENIIVYYKSNNKPRENSYYIKDSYGKLIFKRDSTDMKPNTIYQDTIVLKKGNYTFSFNDNTGNGLEFWYHDKDGYGNVMLLDTLGRAIKFFNSDFGSDINYHFSVQPNMNYTTERTPYLDVFKTRNEKAATLYYFFNDTTNIKVLITDEKDENKIYETHQYTNLKNGFLNYNLSHLSLKRYYLKVLIDDKEVLKNRIRL